jgi:hypothetical protein
MGTDQRFSLRWNNYQSHLVSAFESLLEEKDFVDVTLGVEGRKLPAHKMLLSACSPYFRELLKVTLPAPGWQTRCQPPNLIAEAAKNLRGQNFHQRGTNKKLFWGFLGDRRQQTDKSHSGATYRPGPIPPDRPGSEASPQVMPPWPLCLLNRKLSRKHCLLLSYRHKESLLV